MNAFEYTRTHEYICALERIFLHTAPLSAPEDWPPARKRQQSTNASEPHILRPTFSLGLSSPKAQLSRLEANLTNSDRPNFLPIICLAVSNMCTSRLVSVTHQPQADEQHLARRALCATTAMGQWRSQARDRHSDSGRESPVGRMGEVMLMLMMQQLTNHSSARYGAPL